MARPLRRFLFKPRRELVRLDHAAPINESLRYYQYYGADGSSMDLAANTSLDYADPSAVVPTTGILGSGIENAAADGAQVATVPTAFTASDPDYSLRFVFVPSLVSYVSALLRSENDAACISLYIYDNYLCVYDGVSFFVASDPLVVGQLYDVFVLHSSGQNGIDVYVNGQLFPIPFVNATTSFLDELFRVWGDKYTPYGQWFRGTRFLFSAWERVLSKAEVERLTRDKFHGLSVRARRRARSVGSITAQNASATIQGTATATGVGGGIKLRASAASTIPGAVTTTGNAALQHIPVIVSASATINGVGFAGFRTSAFAAAFSAAFGTGGSLPVGPAFGTASIPGTASVTLAGPRRIVRATSTIAGAGAAALSSSSIVLPKNVGNATIPAVGTVTVSGAGVRLRVSAQATISGVSFVSVPGTASTKTGTALLVGRATITATTTKTGQPAVDFIPAGALSHPVTIDTIEQIYLGIDLSDLAAIPQEVVQDFSLQTSQIAATDGHHFVDAYLDSANRKIWFKPAGGVSGRRYPWDLRITTIDVNSRTQNYKRTVAVQVVTK